MYVVGPLPNTHSSKPPRHLPRLLRVHRPIAGDGPEREDRGVAVIAEVEDARETHGGEVLLVPQAGGVAVVEEEADAAGGGGVGYLAAGHQPQQRPGGLGRRAWAAIVGDAVGPVGYPPFTPAAIGVLATDQPVHGA